MKARVKNLQPWLDYFSMLQVYEGRGFLEMTPDKREAYVTQAALYAVTPGDDPYRQLASMAATIRRIRAYAAWRSREGKDYLKDSFAVHIVKDDEPHDLLWTVLITSRRVWWRLWTWHDHIEVIDYDGKEG